MSDKPGENQYEVKVSLGANPEFSAKGGEASARQDYRAFLSAALRLARLAPGTAPAAHGAAAGGQAAGGVASGAAAAAVSAVSTAINGVVDADVMARTFLERDGVITLGAQPVGDNALQAAILVILYGYTKQSSSPTMSALLLAKSLRLSGLPTARIDRVIKDVVGTLITRSGTGRGMRYGLTNSGLKRAEEVIRSLHA
jgi:hypothetical protein